MADNVVIADSISVIPEWQIWGSVFKECLSDIDLTKLLVYIVDTVDASALPFLASQFDVLGYKGMRMAQTEAEQRELIKNAIVLHKTKGTEWAIINALKSIGFVDIKLKKGTQDGYDHWAKFGIEITNNKLVLTEGSIADITAVVNEYKRAVCVLEDISMSLLIDGTLPLSDDCVLSQTLIIEDVLSLTGNLKYDGTGKHDGTYGYSGESDVVTIN